MGMPRTIVLTTALLAGAGAITFAQSASACGMHQISAAASTGVQLAQAEPTSKVPPYARDRKKPSADAGDGGSSSNGNGSGAGGGTSGSGAGGGASGSSGGGGGAGGGGGGGGGAGGGGGGG